MHSIVQKQLFKIGICILVFLSFQGIAQQKQFVDFLHIDAVVEPIASEKKIVGTMTVTFKVLQKTDSIFLDGVNMKLVQTALESVSVSVSEKKIWLVNSFEANKEYTASFFYEAIPKQTVYFPVGQIWTQGQGKYTSHWLPSIDDMNDKIEFDITIVAPLDESVIANGKLISVAEENSKKYWKWDMQQPMSSYLVAFVIGDFEKKELRSASGIPIELYFQPVDSSNTETTYRYTKRIFDFLETEIGLSYPWQNYKQVPVKDFLYAGMENTTLTVFSEAFVVDSIGFNDRNYVNVNAHEMAHQWFGNLVTETEGTHHWLHEGFASYYALLAEKEIFGSDYYYWKLYNTAEQLKQLSDEGKGESVVNPNASSLTFYEKGAWALHILKELIGEEAFKSAVKNYLQRHSFQNVTTTDFLAEVKAVSSKDISKWETDWLQQSAFKAEQAYESLLQSPFIKRYFEVSALRSVPMKDKIIPLKTALISSNEYIGQEAVYQLEGESFAETLPLYKQGFESDNLFIRQAIALTLSVIPKELQPEYESLLDDASYVTREAAFYNLWSVFPEKRNEYMDKVKGVIGFQDKNVRQLWLVLALVTEGYHEAQKPNYLQELKGYTSPDHSFEIRQRAFGYLNELQLYDATVLHNLVNATVHPTWRFRDFARGLFREVIKDFNNKSMISGMMDGFSETERAYVNSILTQQ
ncbi:aminopeptidase N [Ulvibacter sp. MAR_2010_11]|uniref:M1 family metallopeptidase n=1 Tax=Ulvibacter sp. MAR_2010_11 TaxID=1250229 RepID=UPI000C2BF262|nr:M1 family metallopeptidase [Ulvibacter sp. MAR_2010_11]PKA84572.1 aminopeptidase N [Ulvibacter sp. MAR_2010_11]